MSARGIPAQLHARRAALLTIVPPSHILAAIQARRAALAAQLAQAQQEYQQVEQALALLQRQIDTMHGGLLELDALLADPPPSA